MAKEEARFPRQDGGYFHLTPKGWVRKDRAPFPEDRCETWLYEMEWPSEDAKEQVILTKIWASPNSPAIERLRAQFGNPLAPSRTRNVKLECRV
jgi:hypothetical protein